MNDELLEYYERELGFLRQLGDEFAQKYPKIASQLKLRQNRCDDPHVERMIEAFAFLAARVHLKVDDEFPEITESFLNILYPHYLSGIPSMSIAQFTLDPEQGMLTSSYTVERGTPLYSRQTIQETPCRFRTCYPVTLWPLEVVEATIKSRDPVDTRGKWSSAELRLSLRCFRNAKLSELKKGGVKGKGEPIESLRFFLNGGAKLVYELYEIIFNNTTGIMLTDPAPRNGGLSIVSLPSTNIKTVGFKNDEAMLPYTARSFPGYRLLSEYFAFPDKFLFFDVTGIDRAALAGFGERLDIIFDLRSVAPLSAPLKPQTFQLGCSPIINLFPKIAEPIHLSQRRHEYHVVPDIHRQSATEIYSIDSVSTASPYQQQSRRFHPFYSFRHALEDEKDATFWYSTRRPSQKPDDRGTEVYLSLVDLEFDPHLPANETITVHTTCTNRDLPSKLIVGHKDGDFEVESSAPILPVVGLKKPTAPNIRPPLRQGTQWRLISHLSLNHLSLFSNSESGEPEALQEILLLYDFMDSEATRKQITGIDRLRTRRIPRRIGSGIDRGIVRGVEVTIEFDEEQYVGSGVFLFATVLERFLGLYASVNSFIQLVAKTRQREGNMKKWKPRAGSQELV